MLELLQTLSKEAFAVYVVLDARSREATKKLGMTLMEISRVANVGTIAVDNALDELTTKQLIQMDDGKIIINDKSIPFTKKNTDSERLRKLEVENQRLRNLVGNAQKSSGLHQIAREEDRNTLRKVEELFGRGITTDEAFLLGSMLFEFGPGRVYNAIQNNINANNPTRAAYGFLRGGAMGKGWKKPNESNDTKIAAVSIESLMDD